MGNLPNRPDGSMYRVFGAQLNTTVLLDGVPSGTVGPGGFLGFGPMDGAHRIQSAGNEPIFVTQYMTGSLATGALFGDPAMGNVIPTEQFKSEYTFATVGGAQFSQHWITIICANADVGSLTLNGTAVAAAEYSPIPGSGHSIASLMVSEGSYQTASTQGHGITVQGYNIEDSYLYPGGARFEFINAVTDSRAPDCTGFAYAERFEGTGEDSEPSEDVNGNGMLDLGEDLNNNGVLDGDTGVFTVELGAGSSNLALTVTPFSPGAPIVDFVVTQVDTTLPSSGTVLITDGAGNVGSCPITFVASLGSGVCDPVFNSSGQGAFTTASGSPVAAANDFTLSTRGLPNGSLGFYVVSQGNGVVNMPGNILGRLCILGPVMGRHNMTPLDSGAGDSVSLAVDLQQLPQPFGGSAAAGAGETWYWQYWYRDNGAGSGASNFCGAIAMGFQ